MDFTPIFYRLAALCGMLLFQASALAQQQPAAAGRAAVEVKAVRFAQTKVSNTVLVPMTRVEVQILAKENARLLEDPKAIVPNKSWVDKIKVTVTIAYELPAARKAASGGAAASLEDRYAFYRSSVTIMTMEKNSTGSVFFYLPGEIVKRDQLKQEPYAYAIDLEVDGTSLPPSKSSVSRLLLAEAQYKAFKEMADRGVLSTTGVLRPQYLVATEALPASTPTLIREDAAR
ncbi:MAG: hypothetical protein LBD14_01925 [Puniceicoccales bacterium]|jgi:hypothetical protein|nr:hypothetical protein [Puniceicoccales bacterium]